MLVRLVLLVGLACKFTLPGVTVSMRIMHDLLATFAATAILIGLVLEEETAALRVATMTQRFATLRKYLLT